MERIEKLTKLGTYAFVEVAKILEREVSESPDGPVSVGCPGLEKKVTAALMACQDAAAAAVGFRETLIRERYMSLAKEMLKP